MAGYRALSRDEVAAMERNGCACQDWSKVEVKHGFNPDRVKRVGFYGQIKLGTQEGTVSFAGADLPAEISDATLIDCVLGDNVRVTRVRCHLSNYRVGDGAVVTDVGQMATRAGAAFGNGAVVEPVNEGGGREVPIFNEMSSQFAYVMSMHRYRTEMTSRLQAMVDAYVEENASDAGVVGEGAVVAHVNEILDVNVGCGAEVVGAAMLKNGTVLSEAAARTRVGASVVAEDFIIAEGSRVESGAILTRCFIGQGVEVGKQFSAEHSLFFANSECFNGEACAVFGGPYTVTHHKSTLLIAGIYSFYNAGSGTNQSNHMYKLGPVHQGVLERGSKTGSSSYMLLPSAVGPFTVVIGKHMTNFDIRDLPFSYLVEERGASFLTPAMNLHTVGTIRDGDKWPDRDRRTASDKRDRIRCEVFSPYTVERMMRGEALLNDLYDKTPRDVDQVRHNGVRIRRLVLRHGIRSYAAAIDLYLVEKVLQRVADGKGLGPMDGEAYDECWADVGGLLLSGSRLAKIETDIVSGDIDTVAAFNAAFASADGMYATDEWAWVRRTYRDRTGAHVEALTEDDLVEMKAAHGKLRASATRRVLADAEKEFGAAAAIGYGADGGADEVAADFSAVRGEYSENSFVRQMQERGSREGD
ncbi:MAG: DUF4954 family protein [Gemmatimonadota bacterium]|nr:DUF4954 family protein [Gemmatimonadota bacterium]